MKIISLNTWGGARENELRTFIQAHLATTDVFCFQEVNTQAIENLLGDIFPEQDYCRMEAHKYINEHEKFDLVTLVRNNHRAVLADELFTANEHDVGQALVSSITIGSSTLQLVNVHGIAGPGSKLDTAGRLRQSQRIVDFASAQTTPVIIMGDFNLDISTESVALFTKSGLRNLVRDYEIPATRNRISWEAYPESPQRYADYTFISKNIKIRDFHVVENEVSDHLPVVLSIDVDGFHPW